MIKLSEMTGQWGTNLQPYFYPGANPTVDLVIVKNNKILLIKRGPNATAEAGKWALPGGFHDTYSKKGEPWKEDKETAKQAAIREVKEETNLDVSTASRLIKLIGVFEGSNRDPRDNKIAWSKSTAFALMLPDTIETRHIQGKDDATDAKWFDIDDLSELSLAFDHKTICILGLKVLGIMK